MADNFLTIKKDIERINDKLLLLTGDRGATGKPKSAVIKSDIQDIGSVSITAAQAAGATPTKAEFDALLLDVSNINNLLKSIAARL